MKRKRYPLKQRKFNKRTKAAISAYYKGRRNYNRYDEPWDKQACLREIQDAALTHGTGIREFTALSGTFWFAWSDGSLTIHHETQWWRMKKVN